MCGVERLQPGLTNRKGSFVVYSKGMEQVTDLLTYLGAPAAAMELMQVKMLKEVRNQINRRTNFETANLDKTASAAARQVLAIHPKDCGIHRIGRIAGGAAGVGGAAFAESRDVAARAGGVAFAAAEQIRRQSPFTAHCGLGGNPTGAVRYPFK